MSDHSAADHHVVFVPASMDGCACGAADPDPVHATPPCAWCTDGTGEFGSPAPWWFRAWCKFVTWWLVGTRQ